MATKELKKYYVPIDKGFAIVNEYQIQKPRWVQHFGGIEKVKEFIKQKK